MVSTKIKIKYGGCGIKYTDDHGMERHACKTPEDGPFLCEIEQAKRLVGLGVAEFVAEPEKAPEADKETLTGHLAVEQLEAMEYNDLKKLAADMGVVPKGKKKEDFVKAIAAVEVTVDAEDAVEDPDDLPDLNAADPE